jgi:hypothetical protein
LRKNLDIFHKIVSKEVIDLEHQTGRDNIDDTSVNWKITLRCVPTEYGVRAWTKRMDRIETTGGFP